jgi:protein phosphatase
VRVRFHGRSDPGRRRDTNEDAYAYSGDGGFCVLCDGMGGHSSGEVASRMAVDILAERLRALSSDGGAAGPAERAGRLERKRAVLARYVEESLRLANQAIFERGAREQGVAHGRSMGTTLALLCVAGDMGVVAHVGDSRVYRVRDGALELLTRDHSVTAPEFGSTGRSGRKRKYVTRALGTRAEVAPEVRTIDVRAGDVFVACSDGLTDHVRDDEITEAVRASPPAEVKYLPSALINLANERGGRDNVTVVVGLVEAGEEPPPAAARPAAIAERSAAPAPTSAPVPAAATPVPVSAAAPVPLSAPALVPRGLAVAGARAAEIGGSRSEDSSSMDSGLASPLEDAPTPPPLEPPPPWDSADEERVV